MILLTHILIALASILLSTSLLLSPSIARLRLSYGLIAGTFLSGAILITTTKSHMLETCLMGLAYSAFTLVTTVITSRKLALAKQRADHS